jgi:prepilin-type N-terminal cleavage/methylation domain-containing protein
MRGDQSRSWARGRAERAAGRQAGFSMMELLVAVSLTAIVSGIAILHLPKFYAQYQLSTARRQLATDLVRVRMKAIGESVPYRVVFGSSAYQVQVNNTGTYVNDGGVVRLPSGTRFTSLPSPVSFTAIGTLPNGATIYVTNGSVSRSVRINELGKVVVG